jgi:hypothetical protein
MSSNRIKVVGYAQKVQYNDGIEYRNFSPDLVGVQLASNGGTPLFTMGNFSITTNMEPKSDKTFITKKFSNFITLTDLKLTLPQTQTLLTNNASVILNLDKTNLNYYALFGSLSEFVRVSLEDIITKWAASLYLTPIAQAPDGSTITGYTFQNYVYNPLTQLSTFKVNTTFITNKFQLNYLSNGTIANTFNVGNDLRNVSLNFASYVILLNGNEYPVVGFTGSTYQNNDYVYLQVNGNPFSGFPSNYNIRYHIKPNKLTEEQFFNSLPDFEAYLLNRQVIPPYTSTFKYPIKSDSGVILYVSKTLSWPVSDGYNIDFDTTDYVNYAGSLIDISTDYDLYTGNLMNRFLVSESISAFDTTPVHLSDLDQDTSGQKMNKSLQIYGREFDEINNFISGIAFSNRVTYDKQDNTPDIYLKNLARVLGWELVSSVLEQDLLKSYVTTAPSTYSGHTVGLTAQEADTELWRRIILNTPWLWKSKGARKSIEFLLRFIGAPQGLVKFNEYIYKASAPIDIAMFQEALALNNLSTDLSIYPIDANGYPNPLPNTPSMYFQNNGLWYRETGGTGSTVDILTGNNPHLGPYDGGFKYINQFTDLIPNFSAVTISSQTQTTDTTNLFTNYGLGSITQYSGNTYVDVLNTDGSSLDDCVVITSSIIPDPMPNFTPNDCGCPCGTDDESLSICLERNQIISNRKIVEPTCKDKVISPPRAINGVYRFSYYQYNKDGTVFKNGIWPVPNITNYASQECCTYFDGTPMLYNQVVNGQLVNSGYICCDATGKCGCTIACNWTVVQAPIKLPVLSPTYSGSQQTYLVFTKEDGSLGVVSPDGCNCIATLTQAIPNVTDPYTGKIGFGCAVTGFGGKDLAKGDASVIRQTYLGRNAGTIGCSGLLQPVVIPVLNNPVVPLVVSPVVVPTVISSVVITPSPIGYTIPVEPPVSFVIKVGTISCYQASCKLVNANGSPSTSKTVYVPAGYTPATAQTIYTDSALTTVLTNPFFQYYGVVYANTNGHASPECNIGTGC